jgi:hypothetical protein
MFAIINEQTAKLLQKKRVNLYGMHPIFSGGGAPKENRWARLRSVPLACVRHFADLSRS